MRQVQLHTLTAGIHFVYHHSDDTDIECFSLGRSRYQYFDTSQGKYIASQPCPDMLCDVTDSTLVQKIEGLGKNLRRALHVETGE